MSAVKPQQKKTEELKQDIIRDIKEGLANGVLKKLLEASTSKIPLRYSIIIGVLTIAFIVSIVTGFRLMNKTIDKMYVTYIRNTEEIIVAKSNIELANSWERLPENQRKERLREQYFKIVRYYTNAVPDEQRMSSEQIMDTFNRMWNCTKRMPTINFFLPAAYMKVATNYNPVYNVKYKRGIAALYDKSARAIANLPLVKSDPIFKVEYKGTKTLYNPDQAIALLIARIDDLMTTFNNREDWTILALYLNEYTVIEKYWDEGKGAIPDKLYETGALAETLKYYYAFKAWQIPAIE